MSNKNPDQVNNKLISMVAVKTTYYHIMVDAPNEDTAYTTLDLMTPEDILVQSESADTEWEYYPDLPDQNTLLGVEN